MHMTTVKTISYTFSEPKKVCYMECMKGLKKSMPTPNQSYTFPSKIKWSTPSSMSFTTHWEVHRWFHDRQHYDQCKVNKSCN